MLDYRRFFLEDLVHTPTLFFSVLPRDIQGYTAAFLPASAPKIDPIGKYVQYKTEGSELHDAVRRGDLARVKELYPAYLAMDSKVRNEVNLVGVPHLWLDNGTPLHVAAFYGQGEVLSWLLENGDGSDHYGNISPLHVAAYQGQLDCVKRLVEYDKKVNGAKSQLLNKTLYAEIPELNGQSALSLSTVHDHRDVVHYLCEQGADLDAGISAVYYGQRRSLSHPLVFCIENSRLNSFRTLLPFYAKRNLLAGNISGTGTIIDRVLEAKNVNFIVALFEVDVSIRNSRNCNNKNLFHLALSCPDLKFTHLALMLSLISPAEARDLVTSQDSVAEMTPLHYLCAKQRDNIDFIAMAQLLIAAGAKTNGKDRDGLTPIQYLPIGMRAEVEKQFSCLTVASSSPAAAASAAAVVPALPASSPAVAAASSMSAAIASPLAAAGRFFLSAVEEAGRLLDQLDRIEPSSANNRGPSAK